MNNVQCTRHIGFTALRRQRSKFRKAKEVRIHRKEYQRKEMERERERALWRSVEGSP